MCKHTVKQLLLSLTLNSTMVNTSFMKWVIVSELVIPRWTDGRQSAGGTGRVCVPSRGGLTVLSNPM